MEENKEVARQGGKVARAARLQLEESTGKSAISSLNAQCIQEKKAQRKLDNQEKE